MANDQRILAGHVLRRIGFGPTESEMEAVLAAGFPAYIDRQLHPTKIDDSALADKLPPPPGDFERDFEWMQRWYTRMVYSRRQLQEKMTLIWHEHFAVSNAKVGVGAFMHDMEEFLRRNCLSSFRALLSGITRDRAMMLFLDNNLNSGRATDEFGNKLPPNENYSREFLQLFALGTVRLNMDGTPVLDASGSPIPAYTETDVREVARALSGWGITTVPGGKSQFDPRIHDAGKKVVLGRTIPPRGGMAGASDVEAVVDILMRQPTMAPFISKILIQKLATETPTPAYVQRVATVFAETRGNLRAIVRAIFMDQEFYSDGVVRTQFKEPIEHFVGAVRALNANTRGIALIEWTRLAGQLIYYPPSVFSFYPPGHKEHLVNQALVFIRDQAAEQYVNGYADTGFGIPFYRPSPGEMVDRLSDRLLAAPLNPAMREKVISYFNGQVSNSKVRGAIWLILTSPDYQRN